MWIEIFRAGLHTDSSGHEGEYDYDMLDRIVETYNKRLDEDPTAAAPVVKGHPATDDPALGWVDRLARRGDRIVASIKDLSGPFIKEIAQGKYKKVSIALYPDLMLRHVGFLGAAAPAVKGLSTPNISGDSEFVEFSHQIMDFAGCLNDDDQSDPDSDGAATADDLEDMIAGLHRLNIELQHQIATLGGEKDELIAQNRNYSERIALIEKQARLKEFREYANELVAVDGGPVISPAAAQLLVDLLETAHQSDRAKSQGELSGGDPAVERIKQFVAAIAPVMDTREFAVRQNLLHLDSDLDFTNKNVSIERMRVHEKARELQNETPGLSYEEAVLLVQRLPE